MLCVSALLRCCMWMLDSMFKKNRKFIAFLRERIRHPKCQVCVAVSANVFVRTMRVWCVCFIVCIYVNFHHCRNYYFVTVGILIANAKEMYMCACMIGKRFAIIFNHAKYVF